MESKNQKLGLYDMVLSLSEAKINDELENLMVGKKIHPSWQFFTNGKGDKAKVLTAADEPEKKVWLNRKEGEKELERLDKELDDIDDQLNDSALTPEQRKELTEKRKAKTAEKKALKEQLSKRGAYTILVDAIINAPEIEILPEQPKELLFKLNIKSGHLYHLDGDTMDKIDLSGVVYAFNVPIGSLAVTTKEMVLLDEKDNTRLRSEGINDNDFTIDALLLNFERADIDNYSRQNSKFPAAIKDNTQLQVAFTNFFRSLGNNKDNPYILGYAISKKKLAEREKALLYPTEMRYSTSYGKADPAKTNAFNFLMQTNNNAVSTSNAAGVLGKSLLEEMKDQSGTMSGVMAVNYDIFTELYMAELHDIVINSFRKEFAEDFGTAVEPGVEKEESKIVLNRGEASLSIVLKRQKMVNDPDNSISYDYVIRINGIVHRSEQSVYAEWGFSTSGQYPIMGMKESKGKEGNLRMVIVASDKGELHVDCQYEPPQIGWDTEDPAISTTNPILNLFRTFVAKLSAAILFYSKYQDKMIFTPELFKHITFDGIRKLNSKVILPASNVYTYKNVRLLDESAGETDAVLFDITYAPASFL